MCSELGRINGNKKSRQCQNQSASSKGTLKDTCHQTWQFDRLPNNFKKGKGNSQISIILKINIIVSVCV